MLLQPKFHAQLEDVISLTTISLISVRTGQPESVFAFFKMMLANGLRPNHVMVLSVIRAIDALSWDSMIEGGAWRSDPNGFCVRSSRISLAVLGFYTMRGVP